MWMRRSGATKVFADSWNPSSASPRWRLGGNFRRATGRATDHAEQRMFAARCRKLSICAVLACVVFCHGVCPAQPVQQPDDVDEPEDVVEPMQPQVVQPPAAAARAM